MDTAYDENHTGGLYFRTDGGNTTPGYLSSVPHDDSYSDNKWVYG